MPLKTSIERSRTGDTFADIPVQRHAAGTAAHRLSPSGNEPVAFIVHHTSGRGTPESVVSGWRAAKKGIGTQFIMDRDAVVHDVAAEYGYHGTGHIHPNYLPAWARQAGIRNQTVVGMEIIARNDRDVTPQQAAEAQRWINENYPTTTPYGHGEVNPGHREATEGMTVVSALRRDRGTGPAARQAPTPPARPPATLPAPTTSAGGGTLLFLHGMQSRYNQGGVSRTPAQVEASMAQYAAARNMRFEAIHTSGDTITRLQQIAEAQERINRGGISTVVGFSSGGYSLRNLRGSFERIAIGSPGVPYNVVLPGGHMQQPEALAQAAVRTAPRESTFATTTPGQTAARHD